VIGAELDGCYVSGEFPTFVPRENDVDVRFLTYWFRLPSVIARVDEDCTGSTPLTRNRFKENFFLSLEIPLPPVSEQRRLVARIEELAGQIDAARTLRQQAAEEAEALIQSAVAPIVGNGWPTVLLEQAVDPERPITYGIVQAGDHVPDGVPYIRVSDMAKPKLTADGMLRTSREIAERYRRSAVRHGDLVFAIRATVGKMRFVPKELDGANLTQGTARIAPSDKATAPYLYWALQRRDVVDSIQAAAKGSTFREITLGRLRAIPVPLPPIQDQHRIVAELDALQSQVDALKRQQAESATELDALLPAVLSSAFSGRL
jgi:type I restriction enzyme S subunit